jgi:hypothetical protein
MRATDVGHVIPSDPVVVRWVHHGRRPVDEVLGDVSTFPVAESTSLGAGGTLRLDRPFARSTDGNGTVAWSAPGRVVTRVASMVRFARVEIAVIVWSDELSEVTVRRRGRQVLSWGERRERRYFDLAHDAAEYVAGALAAAAAAERSRALPVA